MRTSATTTTKPARVAPLVVGSHVFFPGHGVASVARIENRKFGQEQQEFYVLDLARGGTLLLPTAKAAQAGVRALVSATAARKLMKQATTEPEVDRTRWKERIALYSDALRTGTAERYTEILRQLLFRSRSDSLSATERQQLETAREYFVGEIGAVLQRSPEQLATQLLTLTDGAASQSEAKQ